MKNTKLIVGVTGIRSDYDIMSSVFSEIEKDPNLHLQIIATGSHLSFVHGNTIKSILDDGFNVVDRVESLVSGDTLSARALGLGIQIQGLTQAVARIKPDLLLVLGDREEAISTALVGSYLNIPVAHVGGGDRVIGNVDDQIRHAVSKLSHIHFTTNQENTERLLSLGEEVFRVFTVGNPGLDRFISTREIELEEINRNLNLDLDQNSPFLILIQHPLSTEYELAYKQMKESLTALERISLPVVIISPNSDAGSRQIINAINEYSNIQNFKHLTNIPRLEFVNLMRKASCLIGNSSAGILEAPSLKIPVVNVGNRQKGRLHAENVQFVNHDANEIEKAVRRALYDEEYRSIVTNCSNPYGEGDSSEKIAKILSELIIDEHFLIKEISY